MLTIESKAYVGAALEDEITEFLLTCTDARYQSWWPGTHLAFHVISRGRPDHTGDVVVELTPRHGGVAVRHTITAGWAGAGRVLDPLWRLYFTPAYITAMHQHVHAEFALLADHLVAASAHRR